MSSITAVNPNAPVPADLSTPFSTAINQYYGSLSLGQQQTILLNFLATNNVLASDLEGPVLAEPTPANPQSPTYAQDLVAYNNALLAFNTQQKQLKLFTEYLKTAANPFEPIPPPVGTTELGNIMAAIVGTLSPAEQQAVWVKFLQDNNLTATYNSGNLVDDVATQQLLLTYLQALIASGEVNLPVVTNETFSASEIKKRAIMFSIFNACINTLLALQNTVSTQTQNLNFLSQWQQQYTNMLTKIPTYVGGESSAVNVNLGDLSKFTLGYSGISIADIARWWANQGYNGSQSFQISSDVPFTAAQPVFPSQTTTFSVSGGLISLAWNGAPFFIQPVPTSGTTFEQRVSDFETAFKSIWATISGSPFVTTFLSPLNQTYLNGLATIDQGQNNQTNPLGQNIPSNTTNATQLGLLAQQQIFSQTHQVTDPYSILEILKPYTYVAPSTDTSTSDTLHNISDSNSKFRGEINSRDQQYIQNASTNRQTIQNTAQQVQTNLGQSQQELSQQTDVITAIVTSLQGILSSIFR